VSPAHARRQDEQQLLLIPITKARARHGGRSRAGGRDGAKTTPNRAVSNAKLWDDGRWLVRPFGSAWTTARCPGRTGGSRGKGVPLRLAGDEKGRGPSPAKAKPYGAAAFIPGECCRHCSSGGKFFPVCTLQVNPTLCKNLLFVSAWST
jgi:hypothetical protein